MPTRLTDDDLTFRHAFVHVLLSALGYAPDDASKGTIMAVEKRLKEAVDQGRLTKDGRGRYQINRSYYDQQVQKNMNQERSADA
jgi:hypothetical protein